MDNTKHFLTTRDEQVLGTPNGSSLMLSDKEFENLAQRFDGKMPKGIRAHHVNDFDSKKVAILQEMYKENGIVSLSSPNYSQLYVHSPLRYVEELIDELSGDYT